MKKQKSERRTLWISDEVWEEMREAARLEGRSVSDWVRNCLTAALTVERSLRADPLFAVSSSREETTQC